MPLIQIGQKGKLQFVASQAGFPQSEVESVSWQPQGSQQAVKFTPPDNVEGIAVGRSTYKGTVTKKTPGEKYSFQFDVECTSPDPPPMVPVTIFIAAPTPEEGRAIRERAGIR